MPRLPGPDIWITSKLIQLESHTTLNPSDHVATRPSEHIESTAVLRSQYGSGTSAPKDPPAAQQVGVMVRHYPEQGGAVDHYFVHGSFTLFNGGTTLHQVRMSKGEEYGNLQEALDALARAYPGGHYLCIHCPDEPR